MLEGNFEPLGNDANNFAEFRGYRSVRAASAARAKSAAVRVAATASPMTDGLLDDLTCSSFFKGDGEVLEVPEPVWDVR